jgi:NDP-sugar pyrophosphorylase family protein
MQIVIPAAGRGTRFNGSEFIKPKPLIEWSGKNMIQHVIENFKSENTKIIVIKRDTHVVDSEFAQFINIDYTTEGPAMTAYLSKEHLDLEDELIITNCDQIIKDWNLKIFLDFSREYDAVLGCFISDKPHNSYVKIGSDNLAIDVREKEVISNIATNGLHYWKKAKYFFDSVDEMVNLNDRKNGEFYIAPSYNYLINKRYKVGIYLFNQHYPIGTPEDLKKYLENGNN